MYHKLAKLVLLDLIQIFLLVKYTGKAGKSSHVFVGERTSITSTVFNVDSKFQVVVPPAMTIFPGTEKYNKIKSIFPTQ